MTKMMTLRTWTNLRNCDPSEPCCSPQGHAQCVHCQARQCLGRQNYSPLSRKNDSTWRPKLGTLSFPSILVWSSFSTHVGFSVKHLTVSLESATATDISGSSTRVRVSLFYSCMCPQLSTGSFVVGGGTGLFREGRRHRCNVVGRSIMSGGQPVVSSATHVWPSADERAGKHSRDFRPARLIHLAGRRRLPFHRFYTM